MIPLEEPLTARVYRVLMSLKETAMFPETHFEC